MKVGLGSVQIILKNGSTAHRLTNWKQVGIPGERLVWLNSPSNFPED